MRIFRKKSADPLEADMTPMIDMVFQLIAFFMVVVNFTEVDQNRGDYRYLFYEGKKVGAVVRTRSGVKPLFISPGYAVSMDDAVRLILKCGGHYRIPEPTRQAHLLGKRLQVQGSTFRVREKDKN